MAATSKAKGSRGRIAEQIFKQVGRLMTAQKLSRTEAFKKLSAKSGRSRNAVATNYYRAARRHGVTLRAPRAAKRARGRARTAAASPAPRRARRRGIGQGIFDQVERMVAGRKMSRTEAFRRLSKRTGRRPGTVAAHYYRMARRSGSGVALRSRRRRGPGRPAGATPGGRAGSTQRLLNRALGMMRELRTAVRRQEAELARLRKENTRFTEIRKLVSQP